MSTNHNMWTAAEQIIRGYITLLRARACTRAQTRVRVCDEPWRFYEDNLLIGLVCIKCSRQLGKSMYLQLSQIGMQKRKSYSGHNKVRRQSGKLYFKTGNMSGCQHCLRHSLR
jgi:hypothetical protein